jgi:succinate dehydrogenase hydrophobic anchor subunit
MTRASCAAKTANATASPPLIGVRHFENRVFVKQGDLFMEERVFFENQQVKVTNARFVVGNQTHAINGITSVSSYITPPSRMGLIVGVLVGIGMILSGPWSVKLIGLTIAGICGFVLKTQKSTHTVVLQSASGKVEAHSGTDAPQITGIVTALNDAIIHRG